MKKVPSFFGTLSYNFSYMKCLLLMFALFPHWLLASPAEEPESSSIPILDSAHDLLGGKVNSVANRLDLFFADQRADDEFGRSRIRLRQSYSMAERAIGESDTQIRFNLNLPSLQKQFKFDGKDKKAKKTKKKNDLSGKLSTPNMGLNTDWQYKSNIGVGVGIPPKLFFANRLRKNFQTGDVIQRFVEEILWFSDRNWEQETTLDSDLTIPEDLLLRFKNTARWKITAKEFTTSHGPSLIEKISRKEAMSYSLSMSTVMQNGSWYVDNYRISPSYRRDLYLEWFYLDITPGIDFPKYYSFRRNPFIYLQLEMLFGG